MIAMEWRPVPGVHALCTTRGVDLSRSMAQNRQGLVLEAIGFELDHLCLCASSAQQERKSAHCEPTDH